MTNKLNLLVTNFVPTLETRYRGGGRMSAAMEFTPTADFKISLVTTTFDK